MGRAKGFFKLSPGAEFPGGGRRFLEKILLENETQADFCSRDATSDFGGRNG
jgi:hypothetical protein